MIREQRLNALREKHIHLKRQIKIERTHPARNEQYLTKLKYQKLRLKDQIEDLRTHAA